LKNGRINPATTPIAFVNGRGASFADAFIIQEKQSVTARKRNDTERTKNIPFCHVSVRNERLKVLRAMKKNDLFVYVTDEQGGGAPSSMANDSLVVTAECHDQLFGRTLAWLRASALENSAIRSDSRNVVDVGKILPQENRRNVPFRSSERECVRKSYITDDESITDNVKYENMYYFFYYFLDHLR
jgi:hypothetical protein